MWAGRVHSWCRCGRGEAHKDRSKVSAGQRCSREELLPDECDAYLAHEIQRHLLRWGVYARVRASAPVRARKCRRHRWQLTAASQRARSRMQRTTRKTRRASNTGPATRSKQSAGRDRQCCAVAHGTLRSRARTHCGRATTHFRHLVLEAERLDRRAVDRQVLAVPAAAAPHLGSMRARARGRAGVRTCLCVSASVCARAHAWVRAICGARA
jgi:hypothetical protein